MRAEIWQRMRLTGGKMWSALGVEVEKEFWPRRESFSVADPPQIEMSAPELGGKSLGVELVTSSSDSQLCASRAASHVATWREQRPRC